MNIHMPCPWHRMSTTESEFNKVPANISLKIRILNVMIITWPITSTNLVVLNSYFHFTLCVLITGWLLKQGLGPTPTHKSNSTLSRHFIFLGMFAKLQSSCEHCHVCPSVCPHGKTPFPLAGFLWNLIFQDFSNICQEYSSFINIWQE